MYWINYLAQATQRIDNALTKRQFCKQILTNAFCFFFLFVFCIHRFIRYATRALDTVSQLCLVTYFTNMICPISALSALS